MVDDEPTILFTFQAILEQQEYEVVGVKSFAEAIEELRQREFDAVIADFDADRAVSRPRAVRARRRRGGHARPGRHRPRQRPRPPRRHGFPRGGRSFANRQRRGVVPDPVDVEEIKSALHKLVTRRADTLSLACA